MRYLQHELDADLAIIRETTTDVSRAVDHNWTDVLVGAAFKLWADAKSVLECQS